MQSKFSAVFMFTDLSENFIFLRIAMKGILLEKVVLGSVGLYRNIGVNFQRINLFRLSADS